MTAPLGFEAEEVEGEDLGSVAAGQTVCVDCHGVSYTGARCTRCWYASLTNRPVPIPWVGSETPGPQDGSEPVAIVPPEFVCGMCHHVPPGPVGDLDGLAVGKGWATRVQHSRGMVMGGTGKQLAVADMWSVRFRRDGWMGYAVRRGAAWSSIAVAGATLPPFLAFGVTELRHWLADPSSDPALLDEVRRREADRAMKAKAAAAARPKAKREGMS